MASVPVLQSGGKAAIDKFLHESAVDDSIPAVFFGATNAKEQLYYEAEGDMVFGEPSKGQVNTETNTEMFSQTKFVTAGKVDLDSVEDIEKHLPELGRLPILKSCDEEPVLEPAQKKITLRMLLSHTAGFVYTHSSPLTTKWAEKTKHPTLFDPTVGPEVLETPLIYEPGTSWTYSHSIDWAGVLVERISGLSLEEYFQTHIFKPCGITSMTFYPTDKIKSNKMAVCYRDASGKVVATPGGFGMGRPESGVPKLHLGGAGLFGTQRDYLTFLRAVLQCDPKNKEYRGTNGPSKPLISSESYAELFKPSVSVDAGLDGTEKIMEMVSKPKYFDPPATKDNLNHSVGFLLNLEGWTGRRKAGSGCWSGAAKTQFWIDPTTDRWYETYVQYEKVLYENLASQ